MMKSSGAVAIAVADRLEGIDLSDHEFRGLQMSFDMIPKHTAEKMRTRRDMGRIIYEPWALNGWIVWTSNLDLPDLDTHPELKNLLKYANDRDYRFVVIGPSEYMARSYPPASRLPTFIW